MAANETDILVLGVLSTQSEMRPAVITHTITKRHKKNIPLAEIFIRLEHLENEGAVASRRDEVSLAVFFRITDEGRRMRSTLGAARMDSSLTPGDTSIKPALG